MQIMRLDDKYRVLFDGEHLPEEVDKQELESMIREWKEAVSKLNELFTDLYEGYGTTERVMKDILDRSCLDVSSFGNWKLGDLLYNLDVLETDLQESDDEISSYEDAELITDRGYVQEWHDSGIYTKVLEDTDDREIVEEVLLREGSFVHRKRTIEWELDGTSKHSKSIIYEDLDINDDLRKVLENSRSMMKDL